MLKLFLNLFRFDGNSVEKAKSTAFEHNFIQQLARYRGQPLTTGGSDPNHAKTEITWGILRKARNKTQGLQTVDLYLYFSTDGQCSYKQ